jgi:DNA-binding NarL/FixJ family response regulator
MTAGRFLRTPTRSRPQQTREASDGRLSRFRVRQMQVLRLLARGATTADVAQSLSISKVTARRHCADISRKLGVHDRGSAVELFLGQLTVM